MKAASDGFCPRYICSNCLCGCRRVTELADRALDRVQSEIALVPPNWWYEIRNLLLINERRKRVTKDEPTQFLELLASYPIQIDLIQNEQSTTSIARQYGITFYDASNPDLALRDGIPLATLDKALQTAARRLAFLFWHRFPPSCALRRNAANLERSRACRRLLNEVTLLNRAFREL